MKRFIGLLTVSLFVFSIVPVVTQAASLVDTIRAQEAAEQQASEAKASAKQPSAEPAAAPSMSSASNGASLSFMQTAGIANLKPIPGREGYYYLTLYDITPYIDYFSAQPKPMEGVAAVDNFVKAWSVGPNSFDKNPPIAIITGAELNGEVNKGNVFQKIILSSPQYFAPQSAIRFVARPISDKQFLYSDIQYKYAKLVIP